MGLVRQLMQAGLILALRGRTLAGSYVFDSRIEGLDDLTGGQGHPVIVISIEEATQVEDKQFAFLGRETELKVLIQTAVASTVTYEAENGASIETIEIAATDAGLEAQLNVLDYQWRAVLSDSMLEWTGHMRSLVSKIATIRDIRVADPETGRKHASRLTEITVLVLPDPVYGHVIPADLLAVLTALGSQTIIPDYQKVATLWRDVLTVPDNYDAWHQLGTDTFQSDATSLALGPGLLSSERLATLDNATIVVPGRADVQVTE